MYVLTLLSFVHHMRLAVGSFLPCSIWSRYCVRENVCQLAEKNEIFVDKYPTFFIVWRRIQLSFSIPGRCLSAGGRLRLKCDDTRAETRFRFSAKRTSPFKSAGASVQSTTGSWSMRISARYTMFRGSVRQFPLHFPPSPPCVTVCHHISTGVSTRNFDGTRTYWGNIFFHSSVPEMW
jgi:hypothetical protein